MYPGLHVKYRLFLSDYNETWIFWADFLKKYPNIYFFIFIASSLMMVVDRNM